MAEISIVEPEPSLLLVDSMSPKEAVCVAAQLSSSQQEPSPMQSNLRAELQRVRDVDAELMVETVAAVDANIVAGRTTHPWSTRQLKLTASRRDVLAGSFSSSANGDDWDSPQFRLSAIVSSTFTDTHIERDLIMHKILPMLRATARKDEIDISFVDMRWGMRDENTEQHLTWIACSNEIERC